MKTSSLLGPVLVMGALVLVGCTALRDGGLGYTSHPVPPPPPPPASFVWTTPPGWRHETIPFPLSFAPGLPYRGVEELRFAPGFFDPSAPGFWSYAFVWWIEEGPRLERTSLEAHLREYFVGLTKAVAKDRFEPDPTRIEVHLEANVAPGLAGTIRTIDAFHPPPENEAQPRDETPREVLLNVRAKTGSCGDRRFLLVTASPKPAADPMWAALSDLAARFQCR